MATNRKRIKSEHAVKASKILQTTQKTSDLAGTPFPELRWVRVGIIALLDHIGPAKQRRRNIGNRSIHVHCALLCRGSNPDFSFNEHYTGETKRSSATACADDRC